MTTDLRPDFTAAVERLLPAVCAQHPRLHPLVKATPSILVVAQGAWGTTAASIRALSTSAERVVVDGVERHLELCLRPPFFHRGETRARLQVLVHELLHIDVDQPRALDDTMRHVHTSQADVDAEAAAIVDAVLPELAPVVLAPLGHDGEVRLRCWLHRPIADTAARAFDDDDVVDSVVRLRTAPTFRTGWW